MVSADEPALAHMNSELFQWARLSANDWYQVKLFLEHVSGYDMETIHAVIGVVLQLLFAWLFKSSVGRPFPLLAVLVLELINEAADFTVDIWPMPGMQYGETAKDIILTMFLPTLIFLVARRRPQLLR